MTATRRDGQDQTPFLKWIRNCPGLDSRDYQISVTDSDIWVHRFSDRKERALAGPAPVLEHIQLIEVKTFSAGVPYAQRDTLDVIDKVLRKASVKNGRRYPISIGDHRRAGCSRHVRWLGLHVVCLSCDRPDNSERIIWDKHDVNQGELVELLRFDRDPDSPARFLDTRRHHKRPAREMHPMLQLVAPRI